MQGQPIQVTGSATGLATGSATGLLLVNKYQSQVTTWQHVRAMQQRMPIQHRHRQTVHAFSFIWIPPHLELYQTIWLASHAHVIPPSHIDCISAFQDISTIKNAVTCTHWLQGLGSRCLVKAEVNSFEYKQRALPETLFLYVFSAC